MIKTILMQLFGQPEGFLGRVGGRLMTRTSGDMVHRVIASLDIQPNEHVLEVGFGSGLGIEQAAQQAAFVAGIDYSETMLQRSYCN